MVFDLQFFANKREGAGISKFYTDNRFLVATKVAYALSLMRFGPSVGI